MQSLADPFLHPIHMVDDRDIIYSFYLYFLDVVFCFHPDSIPNFAFFAYIWANVESFPFLRLGRLCFSTLPA